jgi:phospholipid transport system substrate-binding protein
MLSATWTEYRGGDAVMRMRYWAWIAVLALLCGALAAADEGDAEAGGTEAAASGEEPSPIELARVATEQVFAILRDPELQGEENAEKRGDMVREVVDERFDWRAMAQRSLGRHWRDRTEEEREEFTTLFAELVERTYLSTIERNLDAEIRYEGEIIKGKFATVNTIAIAKRSKVVPISYRLRRIVEGEGDEARVDWRVYDVSIEGVSMVNSYRGQFNDLIVGGSYEKMVERLREKVAEGE